MIVRMKKTTVLCLAEDQQKALDQLGELGVIHVQAAPQQESTDRAALQKHVQDINKVASLLRLRPGTKEKLEFKPMEGIQAFKLASNLLHQHEEATKRLDLLLRDAEQLMPWGQFQLNEVQSLRKHGIMMYLSSASGKELNHLRERFPQAIFEVVNDVKGRLYFAVISESKLDKRELPLVQLPETDLNEIMEKIAEMEHRLIVLNRQLDEMIAQVPVIQEFQAKVAEKLEFATAYDAMESHGEVVSLWGFVPVNEVENLKKAALDNGWGLLLQDPDDSEPVPTLVKLPKWLNFAKVILDFVGISQGYREADVSICFLIFFTIFFGMIVGDAGYGAIFLTLSIIFYMTARKKGEKMRNTAKLCIVMSCASLTFGFLSGNLFAIPSEKLPGFMQGIDFLTNPKTGDDNLKWLCFLIAMTHLCLARVWRTILARSWRTKISELGWGMLLAANFYTASAMIAQRTFPDFALYLYAGGVIFTLAGLNWHDVGDIFNYPFSAIGTFTDTLSYIRLYAVGLSGVYIADSFNNMGMMVMDAAAPSWAVPLLIAGTVLIIVAGHLLNIALSLMGVLVHGIRLNTLEFSSHMGLQWAGYRYRPLKKLNDNN